MWFCDFDVVSLFSNHTTATDTTVLIGVAAVSEMQIDGGNTIKKFEIDGLSTH